VSLYWEFFLAGLATPLTAACALPLYPGFLAYLSNTTDGEGASPAALGALVFAGVLAFMLAAGLVVTTVFERSLTTTVVETASPVAFAVLAAVSLALVADWEVFSRIPAVEPPQTGHPYLSALAYGAFFGAIVLPCNPGLIGFLFVRSLLVTAPVEKVGSFLAFGLGMGTPLLVLAAVSESAGRRVTRGLARRRTTVNRVTGAVMLVVSAYYLVVVFDVFGAGSALGL
jgi:cytochrome c-type biogenesis protein